MTGSIHKDPRELERAGVYMKLALRLAKRAHGRTWPNPMVGAVIVRGTKIVGQGYHHKAGLAHAEVEALRDAGAKAKGADLFVTLEPCHRFGRTPPCTTAIKEAQIARVFVGTRDPNPKESGKGLAVLRRHGIEVFEGILESQCRDLNEVYNVLITKQRPFVTLKAAMSLDGRLAPCSRDARWISSKESRTRAHYLRARSQAVMVGAKTVAQDDPSLDVRHVPGANPAVVVLDSNLSIGEACNIVRIRRKAPVMVFCSNRASSKKAKSLQRLGVKVFRVRSSRHLLDLHEVLAKLLQVGVWKLLVEGGSMVIGSFLSGRLADRVEIFQAPIFLGSGGVPFAEWRGPDRVSGAPSLENVSRKPLGPDEYIRGRLVWPD